MGCWLSVWSDVWVGWSVVRKHEYHTVELIPKRTLMSAWGPGVCIFFRGRWCLSPPRTTDVRQRASRRGFEFSSICERTLAHPGSSPSSFDLPLSMTGGRTWTLISHLLPDQSRCHRWMRLVWLHKSCEGSINRDYPMDILTNGASFSCWLWLLPRLISHFIPVDFLPSYSASFCLFLSPSLIWSAIVSPWRENIASFITSP